jgi:hypothetical protein
MELRSGLHLPDDALPSPPAGGAAAIMAPVVDIPPSPPVRGGVAMDPNANVGANVSSEAVVPLPPIVGGGDSSPPVPSGAGAFFLPPVVLRVLPLWGSSAPVGFIYNASPDPVDGGLVAAASAFFSRQGHQVFHDPCPDLAAYCLASGVPSSSIVPFDRLPDYLLFSGLEILAGLRALLPTDAALQGTAFMAAYLSPLASGLPLVGASITNPDMDCIKLYC